MKHRTVHTRTAVKLAVAGAVAGGLIGTGIALAAPGHADPLSDPNVHCESTAFAMVCDGPIRSDGSWVRQFRSFGGSYYAGPGAMGFIPPVSYYDTITPDGGWPPLPVDAPRYHIEQNVRR